MTTATVKKVATDFLTRKEPGVLALKGAWGVGKTFFWDNLVKELGDKLQPPRYSSVSLFGIASKRELSIALYANSEDHKAPPPKEPRTIRNISQWLPEDLMAAWGCCSKYLARHRKYNPFGDIPWIKNLPRSFEAFASHQINNAVICLDDFERLDEENFPTEELMGFINELKDKKECKVVLIFNEARLGEKQNCYDTYREKVIDMELLYAPTAQESANIAVPPGTLGREIIEECAAKLNITNIRVLRKIVTLSGLMYEEAGSLHPKVMEQALRTLVLFAWCYYEREKQKPTLDFTINRNRYTSLFGKKPGEEQDPQAVQWDKILRDYSFSHADDYDLTIKEIIERGYLEETGFSDSARTLDAKIQNGLNQEDLNKIWDALNNSFDNNIQEFLGVLQEKFNKYKTFVSPSLLNSLVVILRELDQDSVANELIADYITARESETGLFDRRKTRMPGQVWDSILRDRFDTQHARSHAALSLNEAITHIMTQNSWDDTHVEPLRNATEEDFYNCFKQLRGEDLVNFVHTCIQRIESEVNKIPAQNVHRALVRIGNECSINRYRVQRFGIAKEELDERS